MASITLGKYGRIPFERIREQCDLVRKNGLFYLMVAVELPEEPTVEPKDIISIDMGVANIAVDSTGKYYSGDQINDVRERNAELRSTLQSVGTRSAKRHPRKLSCKESRFVRNTNHVISRKIVQEAKGNSSTTAMEKLQGIRMRTTVRRGNMYIHSSWSFHQLKPFIEYRAKKGGHSRHHC